jgi:hypothetical protein
VLKGCDEPYFSFNGTRAFIKLKKNHMAGLGDTRSASIQFVSCKDIVELSGGANVCAIAPRPSHPGYARSDHRNRRGSRLKYPAAQRPKM